MISQLIQWCDINSGTDNLEGLARIHKILHAEFSSLSTDIQTIAFPETSLITMCGETTKQVCGEGLYIRMRPHLTRRVLLSGHMDTVYGINHPFQTSRTLDNNQLNGPGVSDMKGGLVVMLHALRAFEQTSLAHTLGWDVFINADEEIGSPASRLFLQDIALRYQAALVYEPAMTETGAFAKNRKGSGKLTIIATGIAAHAGRAFNEGRNAICFMAEVILAIHALNGKKEGVTINVGKMAGGEALNVVPDKAVVKLDIRITQAQDELWVREQLANIKKSLERPGYALTIQGDFARPVKHVNPPTERLFARIQHIGQQMGLTLNWQDSGGCCDGNNLSLQGLPVIDTLGVRGGAIHSEHEFILLDSLVERAALSTLLLIDLANSGLEELTPT